MIRGFVRENFPIKIPIPGIGNTQSPTIEVDL